MPDHINTTDPVLPSEDRREFTALLESYRSGFAPTTAHEEFLISQMAGARWKLDRVERIENAMFADLGDPSEAFRDKEKATALARLDRYRANLERTYHRCARELRTTRKEQNEANSTELAEKKFEKLMKKVVDAPPPGYAVRPMLVPTDEKPVRVNGTQSPGTGSE